MYHFIIPTRVSSLKNNFLCEKRLEEFFSPLYLPKCVGLKLERKTLVACKIRNVGNKFAKI